MELTTYTFDGKSHITEVFYYASACWAAFNGSHYKIQFGGKPERIAEARYNVIRKAYLQIQEK